MAGIYKNIISTYWVSPFPSGSIIFLGAYMPRNWKEGSRLVLSYHLSTCVHWGICQPTWPWPVVHEGHFVPALNTCSGSDCCFYSFSITLKVTESLASKPLRCSVCVVRLGHLDPTKPYGVHTPPYLEHIQENGVQSWPWCPLLSACFDSAKSFCPAMRDLPGRMRKPHWDAECCHEVFQVNLCQPGAKNSWALDYRNFFVGPAYKGIICKITFLKYMSSFLPLLN